MGDLFFAKPYQLNVRVGTSGRWKGLARDDRSDVESSSDEETSPPHSKISHSSATTNGTSGVNGTNGYLTGGSPVEEH
ncbi:UNVERIFIED_CONTAM: hypothetical protein K2H54_040834 [Gekko kuhli]